VGGAFARAVRKRRLPTSVFEVIQQIAPRQRGTHGDNNVPVEKLSRKLRDVAMVLGDNQRCQNG
jgi:hypothetical protein